MGDFKLIHFYGDGVVDGSPDDPRWELYNLIDDLGEEKNLIDDQAVVASALRTQLLAWMKAVEAQTPVSKLTGKPLKLTKLNQP